MLGSRQKAADALYKVGAHNSKLGFNWSPRVKPNGGYSENTIKAQYSTKYYDFLKEAVTFLKK